MFPEYIYDSIEMNIPLSCTDTWKFWNILTQVFIDSIFSFSNFFHSKISIKCIWTSLTLILSSKVVCIWPHWRPTKAFYFVLSKKRNSFNAYNRTILLHVLNGWIRDLTTRLRTSRKCSTYFSFTPVFTPWPELWPEGRK